MNKSSQTKVVLAILATGIMIFCGMVIETAMNIVFPTLMAEFKISTATVQWMTTSYLLVVSMIVPISAYLKQQFKTKSLFVFAISFFIVGVLIDCFAGNFPLLLSGRVVQGIGTGIALPLMFNIILDEVPSEKIGFMMAVGTLVTAIGPAIGPTLGGLISYYLNWHYIFIFLMPFLIISLVVGLVTIPQSQSLNKSVFNFKNYIFIPVTFIGFIVCLSQISTHGILSWQFIVPLILGLGGSFGFVKTSYQKKKKPLLDLNIFKNRRFSTHVISFMLIQMTLLGLGFLLPNFSQIVLQKNALVAALQLLTGAIIGAIFTIFSGRIMDRFGAEIPIKIGTLVVTIAMLMFTVLSSYLSIPIIVVVYGFFMLGVGFSLSSIMTNGITVLPLKVQSDGNAVFNVVQQFSGALGTTIAATIVSMVQKGRISSGLYISSTLTGTDIAFGVLFILVFISCLSMWFIFRNINH